MRAFLVALVLGLISGSGASTAAEVEKLEVKCVTTEGGSDDVYLEFYVDGNRVSFDKDLDEPGTHEKHNVNLDANGVLVFGDRTLNRLTFTERLRVIVKEDDGKFGDDVLAELELLPSEATSRDFRGKQDNINDFEYLVTWKTGP